ncbi:molybdate ABC transporter substrate-binding protein [Microbacterium aquilitoris]|uniref:molybdate ABC transporter substrate-binding protein n=1 Tax=Microbacterium aquilitoris TaxID=3067307 RepID=UPI0028909C1F|nr:molybdate ABC transporter substrate-binding protein [Microbacterium sp. KSW2-22]MDT3346060.1 molybdate ABC transporter substrate-binding protein [Microbacterium sp. KSW2-22]
MRRSLLRPLALGALALLLTGCAAPAPSPSSSSGAVTGSLTIYAAASLKGSFDEIDEAFTAQHPGVAISPVYDGSSTLATQIAEGAPADVFASADESTMAKVSKFALDPAVFASNTLVIAVPAGNPKKVSTLADLADVVTVLCAPEVPCGAASAKLLTAADVTVDAASLEQNVTAVLTKVAAGEADAGLVYATDVVGRSDVASVVPEGADEVVNRYPIAALKDAANPDAAAAFVAFVRSEAGRKILAAHGFGAP